jgi:endoglucanase
MLLEQLSRLDGVAGQERKVGEAIASRLRELGLEPETDGIGNLLARRPAPEGSGGLKPRRVLICAHMDEVGLMVTEITSDGFLKFSPVGGVDHAILVAKPVRLKSEVPGVIGLKAIHLQKAEERKKLPEFEQFYIDIGCNSREEAEKLVQIGDMACFEDSWQPFGDGLYRGKAFDDRAGCALLLELLETGYPCDLTAAFTVQEEIGLRGAAVLGNYIQADLVLVLEATAARDELETDPEETVTEVGGGPVCSLMDGATVYARELIDMVTGVAQRHNIPLQYRRGTAGGNDAGALQTAGAGLKTMTLSLPCRYIHTMCSVIAERDYENMRGLVTAILNEG